MIASVLDTTTGHKYELFAEGTPSYIYTSLHRATDLCRSSLTHMLCETFL